MPTDSDEVLRKALQKAYTARAKLFFSKLREIDIEKQIEKIGKIDESSLKWDLDELGITAKAFKKIKQSGTPLHNVFCHPDVISENNDLVSYYRNLAALSQKGLTQLLSGLALGKKERIKSTAKILNAIMCELIESIEGFDLETAHKAAFAEIGTEIQGTWVNIIGNGAARNVERMFEEFVNRHKLVTNVEKKQIEIGGKRRRQLQFNLMNGWKIVFSSEPDVAIYDDENTLKVAIEIKGSMDKAGAQTRYGEAKKSFGKALRENPRCETIYLGSCFTKAVNEQIELDGQVRRTYNLIDIIDDEAERNEFMNEIFKHQIRII